ncbi:hypothetical protein [Corynebacterium cystitidis]|uniref:Uncharacterized protein n=1 Tax=Corynebacterium cystitidis DSM 20524 TaxID=1121357 RepID=A0A1H9U5N1_9CORY|nr:hypothetical protein [Corynebacterium cystitidis]WJY81195.1 hypothetical protein CCYS_01060 [Corynebacterium cystitidis DSM 20524]SES04880.1 hypothetical protein SAMN05661109_01682 [Corynebacterium cystitidis DSM 20524]SNV89526.1 Uncharacterised protein [Corynebacterium cystitidis]
MPGVSKRPEHSSDNGKKRTHPARAFAERVLAGVASKFLVDLIHKIWNWMTS